MTGIRTLFLRGDSTIKRSNAMNTQINPEKKPSRRKYIITAVIILCILAGLIYRAITWAPIDSESKKASEVIIRQAVAAQYTRNLSNGTLIYKPLVGSGQRTIVQNKPIDPNTLTDADFTKITVLGIEFKELSDIKLLEKFTNLQEIHLLSIYFPEKDIPSWMKMLSKLGIFNLSERFNIDLSPLKNLSNLQTLTLFYTQTNLDALRNLIYLQDFYLGGTQVTNLEPLRSFTNLKTLYLEDTQVSNLEPLKGLKNLTHIYIMNCPNITDKQIEELKKALPRL